MSDNPYALDPQVLDAMLRRVFVDEPMAERKMLLEKLRGCPGLEVNRIADEWFYPYSRLGYCQLYDHHVQSFEAFSRHMVEDLGPRIWPYLGLLWSFLRREYKGFFDEDAEPMPPLPPGG